MTTYLGGDQRVEAAVFYDNQGETIDYYTRKDLFMTRLTAAHHGLLFDSARTRMAWLQMGTVEMIEVCTSNLESITVPVGDDYCLTVVASAGSVNDDFHELVRGVVALLGEEAGIY